MKILLSHIKSEITQFHEIFENKIKNDSPLVDISMNRELIKQFNKFRISNN